MPEDSPGRQDRAKREGLAPRAGLEPATLRLTAGCSAIELPRNIGAASATPGKNLGRSGVISAGRDPRQDQSF